MPTKKVSKKSPVKKPVRKPTAKKGAANKKHPLHKRIIHRITRRGFVKPKILPVIVALTVAGFGSYFLVFSKAATPASTTLLLRNTNSSGGVDKTIALPYTGYSIINCDWDGNGTDTFAVFNKGNWIITNDNNIQSSSLVKTAFGLENDDVPICGDWDGDGKDGIGVFSPTSREWYLRNNPTRSVTDVKFGYGGTGDLPVVGDWDGNNKDDIGVYRPSSREWLLRNSASGGGVENRFGYGGTGDLPVVGDWDGNNKDDIGVYRPSSREWLLRNSASSGGTNNRFGFGGTGDLPMIGDWNGDGKDTVGLLRIVQAEQPKATTTSPTTSSGSTTTVSMTTCTNDVVAGRALSSACNTLVRQTLVNQGFMPDGVNGNMAAGIQRFNTRYGVKNSTNTSNPVDACFMNALLGRGVSGNCVATTAVSNPQPTPNPSEPTAGGVGESSPKAGLEAPSCAFLTSSKYITSFRQSPSVASVEMLSGGPMVYSIKWQRGANPIQTLVTGVLQIGTKTRDQRDAQLDTVKWHISAFAARDICYKVVLTGTVITTSLPGGSLR